VAGSFINEVIAGDGTYKLVVDLPINLKAGEYFVKVVMSPVTVLTGYSVKPTTLVTNMAVDLINEGQAIPANATDDLVEIEKEVSATSFSRSGIYEAFLICSTELSTIAKAITKDGVPLTAF
jgi:hypothetical protein